MDAELPLAPPGAPLFRDRFETKVASWVRPWSAAEPADVTFIGAPLSKTSISHSGASATPQAVREMFGAVTTYDLDRDLDLTACLTACDAGNARVHPTDPFASRRAIREAVAAVVDQAPGTLPVILGGDHSITAPAVEAVAARWKAEGGLGLVQLDAHMDVRNLEDGGPTNGTPIRQLLENGSVSGRHIAQVGLQPWANAAAYHEYARAHGITQITAREVAHGPVHNLVTRTLDAAGNGTGAIYVTLDMDVLDQAFAPGVPAMSPGGMTPWQLFEVMAALGADHRVVALDVVEVDASLDPRRATTRVAVHAILHFLAGYAAWRGRRGAPRGGAS